MDKKLKSIIIIQKDDSYESGIKALKQKREILKKNDFTNDGLAEIEITTVKDILKYKSVIPFMDIVFLEKSDIIKKEDIILLFRNYKNNNVIIKTY